MATAFTGGSWCARSISTGKRDAAGRAIANADMLVVTLYAVSVWISWKDGHEARSVRLSTDRLLTSVAG